MSSKRPQARRVFDRSTPLASALLTLADIQRRGLAKAQESWARSVTEGRLLAVESDAVVRALIDAQRAQVDHWRSLASPQAPPSSKS